MAKYSKKAGEKVEKAMKEMKQGKLRSGRSGKKVTNPKQAIAIGLSEAREKELKFLKKHQGKRQPGKGLLPDRPLSFRIYLNVIKKVWSETMNSNSLSIVMFRFLIKP
jgi:hypothetical protein